MKPNTAFKKWFGKSLVVDTDLNPLRVFHGSPAKFLFFNYKKHTSNGAQWGKGFYFTNNPMEAAHYGDKIYPVYLKIEKPISLNGRSISQREVLEFIIAAEKLNPDALSNWGEVEYEGRDNVVRMILRAYKDNDDDINLLNGLGVDLFNSEWEIFFREVYRITGYDGIIVPFNYAGNGYDRNSHYIAFLPESIKSVFNFGSWHANSKNILNPHP